MLRRTRSSGTSQPAQVRLQLVPSHSFPTRAGPANPSPRRPLPVAEHKHHTLTRLAFNNPYLGCYTLALTIFSLGILRDHLYTTALTHQPTLPALGYAEVKVVAAGLFAVGAVLVGSSMWALGVTGTYLGDYFGIL